MKKYKIDTDAVLEVVREEVSRVAAAAYTEEGTSMYDAIIITSKDFNVLEHLIEDSVSALLTRFSGIATKDKYTIYFDLPDSRSHGMDVIAPEIDRFLAMNTCAAWLLQKYKSEAESYGVRAKDALGKAEQLMYEILPPVVPEHKEDNNEDEEDNTTQGPAAL